MNNIDYLYTGTQTDTADREVALNRLLDELSEDVSSIERSYIYFPCFEEKDH